MKKFLKILPVLVVFTVCAIAYVPLFAQKDWKMNTGIPEISLRENEQELANRLNGGYEQIYSTGFISLGGYPKIRFKHGEHSFMLPDNSHVLASSQEGNGWGVTSIEVDAEFYRSDRPDKHLQARKKFLELLRELQAKGWKRYYYPGGARMADKIDIFQIVGIYLRQWVLIAFVYFYALPFQLAFFFHTVFIIRLQYFFHHGQPFCRDKAVVVISLVNTTVILKFIFQSIKLHTDFIYRVALPIFVGVRIKANR